MVTDTERAGEELSEVAAAQAARWRELDPLLPEAAPLPPPGADAVLLSAGWPEARARAAVRGGSGDPGGDPPDVVEEAVGVSAGGVVGAAVARVRQIDVDSLDASWSAALLCQLTARVAGPDPVGAMEDLLRQWRAGLPEPVGEDSAATIVWPSRDTALALPFVRHGLSPLVVIAARPAGRAEPVAAPEGVRLRRAEPADLADLVALRLATIQYDEQFGVVRERPATAERLREHTEQVFARADPWTWVAEQDGAVLGMIAVDQPPHADWMGAMTSARPLAYVDVLGVRPGGRGTGVGGALLAHAHRHLDEAGVAVTLLHHALPNPLSTPFYGRHGYRPLYTIWETRPASTLR
jgi:ribosomal protein S18 acetylase RimI-like enzyme